MYYLSELSLLWLHMLEIFFKLKKNLKYPTEYRKYPYALNVNMNVAKTWLVLNPWLYVSLQDASFRGTAEGIFAPETKKVSCLKVFCCFSSPFHIKSQRHNSKNGNLQAAEEWILIPGFSLQAVIHSVLATGMQKSIVKIAFREPRSQYYSPRPIMLIIYDFHKMLWVLRN